MLSLCLFSLFWLLLSLAHKPAQAQYPGSGGGGFPGSGGPGSGGGGFPGSGGPGSGGGGFPGSGGPGSGGSSGSPSWQTTVTSTGIITATTDTGTQAAVWNTPGEGQLSYLTISTGHTACITTTGTYYVVMQWLMPDGTTPPASFGKPTKNMLVDKICTMTWLGPSNTSTGVADNGLGATEVDAWGPPMAYGKSDGEKYTVEDGSSGTISYAINVSSTVQATKTDVGSSTVSVSRNLNLNANPIVLNLRGTAIDTGGNDNILIGQYCQAGVYTPTPQASFLHYQWTINGNTFKSYNVSDNQSGTNGSATISYLTVADILSSSPAWSWISEGNGDVSVQADVYVISGFLGATLTWVKHITDTRPVTVVRPVYSCFPMPGSVNIWQDTSRSINGPVMLQATGPGMTWTGSVLPQPLFGAGGSGRWNFVQKIQPDRSYFAEGNFYEWSINGQQGLDSYYPYPAWTDSSFDDLSTPAWKDDNSTRFSDDSPRNPLENYMTSFSVSDAFWTYMMYKPQSGTWVPLHRIAWQWNANVIQPANGWGSAVGRVGNVIFTENKACQTHPLWDEVLFATARYNIKH